VSDSRSIAFSFFIGCNPLLHTVILKRDDRSSVVRILPQLAPEGPERGTESKQ